MKVLSSRSDTQKRELLSHLESRDFVYPQAASPEVEYTFKHALTQEVAYNSMLIERRRRLHLQAAQATSTLYSQSLNLHYDELILHYERGGEPGRAREYLRLASDRAFEFSDFGKVLRYIRHGFELAAVLPERSERSDAELQGQIGLASMLGMLHGWRDEEIAAACQRALELGREIGNDTAIMSTLNLLRVFHTNRGDLRTAADVATEHLSMATRLADRLHEVWARVGLGEVLFLLGQFALSREHNERATIIYDTELQLARPSTGNPGGAGARPELRPTCAYAACGPLWNLGFPDQARRKSAEAVRLAEQADLHVLAWALWHTTWLHLDCGDLDAAKGRIDRLVTMTNRYGLNGRCHRPGLVCRV